MGMPAPLEGASSGWSVSAIVEWVAFAGMWALFAWSAVGQAAGRRRQRRRGKKAGWAATAEDGPCGCHRVRTVDGGPYPREE